MLILYIVLFFLCFFFFFLFVCCIRFFFNPFSFLFVIFFYFIFLFCFAPKTKYIIVLMKIFCKNCLEMNIWIKDSFVILYKKNIIFPFNSIVSIYIYIIFI